MSKNDQDTVSLSMVVVSFTKTTVNCLSTFH